MCSIVGGENLFASFGEGATHQAVSSGGGMRGGSRSEASCREAGEELVQPSSPYSAALSRIHTRMDRTSPSVASYEPAMDAALTRIVAIVGVIFQVRGRRG